MGLKESSISKSIEISVHHVVYKFFFTDSALLAYTVSKLQCQSCFVVFLPVPSMKEPLPGRLETSG